MANTQSAKKQIRQNEKRRLRNKGIRTGTRTAIKRAHAEIEAGNVDEAAEAIRQAISRLDRAESKGVVHKNNVARRKSRLMKRLAALEAQNDS